MVEKRGASVFSNRSSDRENYSLRGCGLNRNHRFNYSLLVSCCTLSNVSIARYCREKEKKGEREREREKEEERKVENREEKGGKKVASGRSNR